MADDLSIARIHELRTGSYSPEAYVAIDMGPGTDKLLKLPIGLIEGTPGKDGVSPTTEIEVIPKEDAPGNMLRIRITDADHEYGQDVEVSDDIIDVTHTAESGTNKYRISIRQNSIDRSKLKDPIVLIPDTSYLKFHKFSDERGVFTVLTLTDSLKNFIDTYNVAREPYLIGGREYKTVTIGGMTWLAENLDFKFCDVGVIISPFGPPPSTTPTACYYNNDETIYGIDGEKKCGLLYNWYAVKYLEDHKAALIPGWHVATALEWEALANAAGGASDAGTRLKALDNISADGTWPTGWGGTDDYGFSAVPAGFYGDRFNSVDSNALFWTSTESSSSNAYYRYFSTSSSVNSYAHSKYYGYSVRLVKDTFVTIGGRKYRTIRVGPYEWLAENLDFKFCDVGGDTDTDRPHAWYYDNDEATYGIDGNKKCGLLYNWSAVKFLESHINDLIPGWIVPPDGAWYMLSSLIPQFDASLLKAKDNTSRDGTWPTGWGGTDAYGFSAYPDGYWTGSIFENDDGPMVRFWTTDESSSTDGKYTYLSMGPNIGHQSLSKSYALHIRLFRYAGQ